MKIKSSLINLDKKWYKTHVNMLQKSANAKSIQHRVLLPSSPY